MSFDSAAQSQQEAHEAALQEARTDLAAARQALCDARAELEERPQRAELDAVASRCATLALLLDAQEAAEAAPDKAMAAPSDASMPLHAVLQACRSHTSTLHERGSWNTACD